MRDNLQLRTGQARSLLTGVLRAESSRVALFYGVVLVVLFWKSITQGSVLYPQDILYVWPPWNSEAPAGWQGCANCLLSDEVQQYYPYAYYRRERLASLSVPLWNPYAMSGTPFLASPQTAVFYPMNLLTQIVPLGSSFVVSAFLRLLVAGFFMDRFARQIRLTATASLLVGLAFMLSAYNVVWLGYPHINGLVFLPAILFYVVRIATGSIALNMPPLAVAVGCMLLGGHPEEVLHSLTLIVPLAFTVILFVGVKRSLSWWKARCKRLVAMAIACVLGVGLAGVMIVPFFSFLLASSTLDDRNSPGAVPAYWQSSTAITFFVPKFFGTPTTQLYWGPNNLNEICGYVGLLTICLALASLTRLGRDWRVTLFALVGAFALSVTYGLSPIYIWFASLPGYHQSGNARMLFVAELCLAVLGGLGFDLIVDSSPFSRTAKLIPVFAGIGGTAILAAIAFLVAQADPPTSLSLHLRQGADSAPLMLDQELVAGRWFGIMLAAAAVVLALSLIDRRKRLIRLIAPAILAVDLLTTWMDYNPAVPPSLGYEQVPPSIAFLQQRTGDFRIVGVDFPTLAPDAATVYNLSDIRGYDIPTLKRYVDFFGNTVGTTNGIGFDVAQVTPRSISFLRLLGVRYILSTNEQHASELQDVFDSGIHVYEDAQALPRVFFVDNTTPMTQQAALAELAKPFFNPLADVIVETAPDADFGEEIFRVLPQSLVAPAFAAVEAGPGDSTGVHVSGLVMPKGFAPVVYREVQPEHLVVDVDEAAGGYVVVTNSYDVGWHATVNGKAVDIVPADVALQAIKVPAGRSHVEIWYMPGSVVLGAGLSGLSALCLASIVVLAGRVRSRVERGSQSS